MKHEIEFCGIYTNPKERTITLLIDKKFDEAIQILNKSKKFEPYKDESINAEFPTIINFILEDNTDFRSGFKEDVDIDFAKLSLQCYYVFLKEQNSEKQELIRCENKVVILS